MGYNNLKEKALNEAVRNASFIGSKSSDDFLMDGEKTYTEADLVNFGKRLLSQERTDSIKEVYIEGDTVPLSDRLKEVYHSDVEDFKASL